MPRQEKVTWNLSVIKGQIAIVDSGLSTYSRLDITLGWWIVNATRQQLLNQLILTYFKQHNVKTELLKTFRLRFII